MPYFGLKPSRGFHCTYSPDSLSWFTRTFTILPFIISLISSAIPLSHSLATLAFLNMTSSFLSLGFHRLFSLSRMFSILSFKLQLKFHFLRSSLTTMSKVATKSLYLPHFLFILCLPLSTSQFFFFFHFTYLFSLSLLLEYGFMRAGILSVSFRAVFLAPRSMPGMYYRHY